MEKNLISLESIYIPPEKDTRIRESESLERAVKDKSISFIRFGQLQPILVERLKEPIEEKEWKLIDGQVRFVTILALTIRHGMGEKGVVEAFEKHGMIPGMIEATSREDLDPVVALMMEYHANEDRDNFTWEEKGKYVRRIHDMLTKKYGKKEWTSKKTAEYINQSEATVSHYLQLTDPKDISAQSVSVKKATTKGAALKQLKIEKARVLRKAQVESASKSEDLGAVAETARLIVYKGDCRAWIKKVPDESFAWFHWDPPYGGDEGKGGAFAAHAPIQTDHQYMMKLVLEMLPEIWRTLHDGGWLVMWYTPVHYFWLLMTLHGHRFNPEGICHFCEKHIIRDYTWLVSNYSCRPSAFRFWVNPYPNMWRKVGRVADGHEITRFFTKETEPFLLAGKNDKDNPILLRSDRGNLFEYGSISQGDRRHVHHKPPELLSEILSCISVPGSLGGDAGGGSGSIIEAAYDSSRRVLVAELDEHHHTTCLSIAIKKIREKRTLHSSMASWIKEKFGG